MALSAPPAPPAGPTEQADPRRGGRLSGHRMMVVLVVLAFGTVVALLLPIATEQDTWLAFVAGRLITFHGVPHHVTLTLFPHGRAWDDQQWLAQLLMYELERLGGVPFVGVVQAVVMMAAVWAGTRVASTLGASDRATLIVLPVAGLCVALDPAIRTQAYGYPLFVLLVWLLATDSRRPGLRVFWCLPILVLWGNIHGAASLGAGLTMLRGFTVLSGPGRRGSRGRGLWTKGLVLLCGAPLCLLVTPFGLSIVHYYDVTLFNSSFRHDIGEWEPVTSSALYAVPVFLLAGLAVWSFGRHPDASTRWEKLALLVLAVGGISAIRNTCWVGLGAVTLLPVSLTPSLRRWERPLRAHPKLDFGLLVAMAAICVITFASTLGRFSTSLAKHYPSGVVPVLRAATAGNDLPVFADERYADWLIWQVPRLHGRLAFDTSFEVLTGQQLGQILNFKDVVGVGWQRLGEGYRLFVLSPALEPQLIAALERERGTRVLYDHAGVDVIERTALAAGVS